MYFSWFSFLQLTNISYCFLSLWVLQNVIISSAFKVCIYYGSNNTGWPQILSLKHSHTHTPRSFLQFLKKPCVVGVKSTMLNKSGRTPTQFDTLWKWVGLTTVDLVDMLKKQMVFRHNLIMALSVSLFHIKDHSKTCRLLVVSGICFVYLFSLWTYCKGHTASWIRAECQHKVLHKCGSCEPGLGNFLFITITAS